MRLGLLMAGALATATLTLAGSPSSAEARACAPGGPAAPPAAAPSLVATEVPLVTQETRIHWTRTSRLVRFGDAAVLEGQVLTESGALAEARVDLYERRGGAWAYVDSATTDQDTGVFAFGCLAPRHNTRYRAVHEATGLNGRSHGDREVRVARRVPDAMSQTGPTRFLLEGSVAPRYRGPITLQRRDCDSCAWTTTRRGLVGNGSAWAFRIDVAGLSGAPSYRVAVPADDDFAASPGDHVWRITVG